MLNLKKKNIKRDKNSGITLIALVVTIIVILILAGISLATISGNNGAINKAIDAKNKADRADILEKIETAEILALGKSKGDENYNILRDELKKEFGTEGTDWEISPEEDNPWVVKVGDVEYPITHGTTGTEGVDQTPPTITITRSAWNKCNWTVNDQSEITGYKITSTSTEPTDGWITEGILTSGELWSGSGSKHYVWAKDASGNVGSAFINAYSVSITCDPKGKATIREGTTYVNALTNSAILPMSQMQWVFEGSVLNLSEVGVSDNSYSVTEVKLNGNDISVGDTFTVNENKQVKVSTTH